MEEIKEKWKPYNFDNLSYLVSNFGRIIGCSRNREIKARLNQDGYLYVTLGDTKHRTSKAVHRIVAELFVLNDDPKNKVEVNHKDTNRANPRFDNLEWTTHYDNVQYSVGLGNYEKPYFKGENNPNYGNHILSQYYKDNPDIALEKLSRPGKQNGRATPIAIYGLEMNLVKTFDYIGECCEWLIENGYTRRKNSSVNSLRTTLSEYTKSGKTYMQKFYIRKI